MSLKLEEFTLKSYDERQVLLLALTYWESHMADDWPNLAEALNALQLRVANTICQPGGCEYCSDIESDYNE